MISEATRNATSLPAGASGPSRPEWQDGQTTDLFGPVAAPASRSARQAKAGEPMIQGICGRTFIASSESADRPLWLESRFQPPLENGVPLTRKCSKCGEEKVCSDFYRTRGKHASSSGYHAQCKTCCKARQATYRSGSTAQRSASHKKYRLENRAKVLIGLARSRAKEAGIIFELAPFEDQIQARIDAGVCEMSGLPFSLEGGRTWDSPSLDRIVPELGYTITNVRVVLFALNVMMNTWGAEKMIEIASRVQSARQEDANSRLGRWETRLKERLASIGSTESALIWTQAVTPQGFPISRLAPSTRHTNGTGSIGSPWSTPRASDGEKGGPNMSFGAGGQPLPAQMHQAMWVTASSRDWKDTPGMATSSGDRTRIDQLPRQMAQEPQASRWSTVQAMDGNKGSLGPRPHDTGVSLPQQISAAMGQIGPTPTGSSATTAKRGAPNPVFAFWLMGFPDEWISGALEEMRLFRLKPQKSSRRSSKPRRELTLEEMLS
jgi:hypothetical protein